jgi:hypothetical protein
MLTNLELPLLFATDISNFALVILVLPLLFYSLCDGSDIGAIPSLLPTHHSRMAATCSPAGFRAF